MGVTQPAISLEDRTGGARTMDDLSRFCCLNSDCPDHGKRGAGNLTVTSRYGPDKARRMLRCRTCKARFSERKGTPLFDSRLPPEKVDSVLEHIAEGCGVRQTGRLCRVNRDTVGRLQPASPASTPATSTTSWSRFPPGRREVQFDEKWAFVAKKEANCDPDRPGRRPQGGLPGTTSPSTPSAGWSSASCPARGRPRTPWRWSRTSSAGPGAG